MSCGQPHETDCRDVIERVYLYLDGEELDDEGRGKIRIHLDECAPCLRQYGLEQEVKALVARCCGSELAPAELKDRLRLKLSELVVNAEARELRTD